MSTPHPATAPEPNPRTIKLIVIHCSASPNGQRITTADIDGWHKKRGFMRDRSQIGFNAPKLLHIGYHYVIEAAGPVTGARGEGEVGAHVAGFNRYSIGVCMVGTHQFSAAQWASLKGLVAKLKERYPEAKVVGHRDLSPDQDKSGAVEPYEWLKTCPGFDVSRWVAGGMAPVPGQVLDAKP